MIKNYTSWNAYDRDISLRKKLERDLFMTRLRARIPNPVIRQQALMAMNVIRQKLSALPSKRDTVNFIAAHSPAHYQNSPDATRSSWIRGILYNPVANLVSVRMPNSSYPYAMNFNNLRNFLRYQSLGRYYNKRIKV